MTEVAEGPVEVDMRPGKGVRWSDVTAAIDAGSPAEPTRAVASDPVGVTPAGDPVYVGLRWF
jgi:hypothetical protein